MKRSFKFLKPEFCEFELFVRVTSKGEFVATLPPHAVNILEGCGVRTYENQLGNHGYLTDKTLDGLCGQVDELFSVAASEELVEEAEVISYRIDTMGNCCEVDGKLWPRGFENRKYKWRDEWFTKNRNGNNKGPFGFTWVCLLRNRKTYRNKLGKTRVEYDFVKDWQLLTPNQNDRAFIACIVNIQKDFYDKEYFDIPATPEACHFFAELLRSFYALCERIHTFLTPDGLKELIANNGRLLGDGK